MARKGVGSLFLMPADLRMVVGASNLRRKFVVVTCPSVWGPTRQSEDFIPLDTACGLGDALALDRKFTNATGAFR